MFKTHRVNHDFQLVHFLAGRCHTPDAAYALMHDLKDDREAAINNYHVATLRNKTKRDRFAQELVRESEAAERKADLLELDYAEKTGKVLFDAAQDELACINKIIAALEPMRKYKDLPDAEAFEKAQEEEWLYELLERVENMLFCTGSISPDHFATMRQHPEFVSTILPFIIRFKTGLMKQATVDGLLDRRPGPTKEKMIDRLKEALALPAPSC